MFSLEQLKAAADLIYETMPPTPQICWPLLCQRTGAEVWVKHENHTPIGAFKVRGGITYMDALRKRNTGIKGVIAATRGNHGQSVAMAAARMGLRSVIVVPTGNSKEKNAAMRALGATLIEQGGDFQDALDHAAVMAKAEGLHFVPSFDRMLVLGVASYALELFTARPTLDTCYVPIGLGSGICGAIAVRDALGLATRIVGVVAAGAPAYALSYSAGKPMAFGLSHTIADGLACRVPDPDALQIILRGASRILAVNDDEIRNAMRYLYTDTHNVAEGAGAAALAGLLKEADHMQGRQVAVILSGSNIDRDQFAEVLSELAER